MIVIFVCFVPKALNFEREQIIPILINWVFKELLYLSHISFLYKILYTSILLKWMYHTREFSSIQREVNSQNSFLLRVYKPRKEIQLNKC